MKKSIIICSLLVTSLFAGRYMMLLEYNFIKGCSQGDKNKLNGCICMLSEIQKTTSQTEMIDFSIKAASGQKTSDKLKARIMKAATKCIDIK